MAIIRIMQNTVEPETYASYWIRKYEVPAASYRIMRPTAGRMLLKWYSIARVSDIGREYCGYTTY